MRRLSDRVTDGERLTEGRFALFTGGEPENARGRDDHDRQPGGARRRARRSSRNWTTSRSPWPSCGPG